MKTEQIQIFKYEELGEKAKEKAIEQFSNINYDVFDGDYLIQEFCEDVEKELKIKINPKDVEWGLGGRDDMLGVEGRALVSAIADRYPEVSDIYVPKKVGVFLGHLGGGMCSLGHTEKDSAEITFYEDDDSEDELKSVVNKKMEEKKAKEIQQIINNFIDLCEKGYKRLYDEWAYQGSREAIEDTIKINEYDFLEGGERW